MKKSIYPYTGSLLALAGACLFMSSLADAQEMPFVDDYVVTGTRTERDASKAPIATEVLSKEELQASGARTLSDVLQQQPGVTIDREFTAAGAGVRLQGLDPKHVLILINGQPVIGRFGGTVDMDRFPVEDIDRIEIVKGPSSALYGSDAMGGVINIITSEAQGPPISGEIGGSYGTLNEVKTFGSINLNADKWNVRTSAGFHRRDAFDLDPANATTTGGDDQMVNAENRTAYSLSKDVRLTANLRFNHRERDDVDVSRGTSFDRNNLTNEGSIALGPTIAFDDGSSLQVVGYYALFDNTLTISSEALPDTVEDTLQQLGQVTATYTRPLLENHDVTFVGEGIVERYEADRLDRRRAERMRAAVAVQDEWRITKAAQVVGGVRVDHDTQFGTHPTPKVAFRFDPVDVLTLRASYGMGFRAPDFKELYLEFNTPNSPITIRGNSDLEAETSHGFNAGAELNVGVVSLSLSGFRNDVSNLILVKPVLDGEPGMPTNYAYQNVAEARTQGLETTVSALVIPELRLGAGYMLTDAQDLEQDRKLEGRPTHRANASLSYLPSFGFEGTVGLTVVGSRPYYEPQFGAEDIEVSSDPYAMLDIRLAQRLPWDFKIFGGVRNALDAGDVNYLSVAPRTFYAGLSMDFSAGQPTAVSQL